MNNQCQVCGRVEDERTLQTQTHLNIPLCLMCVDKYTDEELLSKFPDQVNPEDEDHIYCNGEWDDTLYEARDDTMYEVWIEHEDGIREHRVCQCTAIQAYWIIQDYERLHTTMVESLLEDQTLAEMTEDLTLLYWHQGNIELMDPDTGERFNYVEVQGGYGLEPMGVMFGK